MARDFGRRGDGRGLGRKVGGRFCLKRLGGLDFGQQREQHPLGDLGLRPGDGLATADAMGRNPGGQVDQIGMERRLGGIAIAEGGAYATRGFAGPASLGFAGRRRNGLRLGLGRRKIIVIGTLRRGERGCAPAATATPGATRGCFSNDLRHLRRQHCSSTRMVHGSDVGSDCGRFKRSERRVQRLEGKVGERDGKGWDGKRRW